MNPVARIGFLLKGDYSDTEMYDFMDIVYYNGASYVAKKPTIGNVPVRKNEYWQIFAEGGTLTEDGDISNTNVTFEQASDRVNISSKEKLSVIMGKIKKYFADLKTVAFSGSYADLSNKPNLKAVATTGSYSDLSDKPTIPTVPSALKNPQALTFTGGATGSYDGSAAKSVKIPSLTNNLLATAAGTALDAVQGKVINDKVSEIYSNLTVVVETPIQYAKGFTDGDQNWKSLIFTLGKIMIVSINCKYSTDISQSIIVGNIEHCYGNIYTSAKTGTLSIINSNQITFDPQGNIVNAGEWIQGCLVAFVR